MKAPEQQVYDDLAEVIFAAVADKLAHDRGVAGIHCVKSFDDDVTTPVLRVAQQLAAVWAEKYADTDEGVGD